MKPSLRLPLALVLSLTCGTAFAAVPGKIVPARVFPNTGQIGLFIAAADTPAWQPTPSDPQLVPAPTASSA